MLKTTKNITSPTKTTAMRIQKFLRSKFWLCAVFILLSNIGFAQQSTKKYLEKYKPVSVELMRETGIPASVILGVAMLESGSGTSRNAKVLNNHFGIVGKNNLAKSNAGFKSRYKQYATDLASYEHFVAVLARKKWFGKLKGNDEFSEWLKHMNHSGYSSAGQEWIRRVTSIINRYKLYKLDAPLDDVASRP